MQNGNVIRLQFILRLNRFSASAGRVSLRSDAGAQSSFAWVRASRASPDVRRGDARTVFAWARASRASPDVRQADARTVTRRTSQTALS